MQDSGNDIVILSNELSNKGGTNRVLADLVWGLAPHVRLTVVSLDGDLPVYSYPTAVSVVPIQGWRLLTSHRALRAIRSLGAVPRLGAALRRLRPQVVVSFLARANIANVLARAAARLSYRTVLCERNYNILQYARGGQGRLFLTLMRQSYRRADLLVANSSGLADSLRRDFSVPADRIRVIYNPLDLERIHRLAAAESRITETDVGPPLIISVGRLELHKNQAMLIRAFASVRRAVPCRLMLVGDGPVRQELLALATSLGVAESVQFTGWVDNPFPLLRRAAVFALASDFEGFPNALVEAMACGCPVVTTDCPSGPREITLDGTCGLLVPVRDEPALTAALQRVLTDPVFAKDLGDRGAARARDFDINRVLHDFRAILTTGEPGSDLLGEASASSGPV